MVFFVREFQSALQTLTPDPQNWHEVVYNMEGWVGGQHTGRIGPTCSKAATNFGCVSFWMPNFTDLAGCFENSGLSELAIVSGIDRSMKRTKEL